MERTARGRYETHLDDPEFTVTEDGTRFAGFFLGDGEDDPAVFPLEVSADYRFPVISTRLTTCRSFCGARSGWARSGTARAI